MREGEGESGDLYLALRPGGKARLDTVLRIMRVLEAKLRVE